MGFFTEAEKVVGQVGAKAGEVAVKVGHKAEGWGAKADVFVGEVLQKAADAVKSEDASASDEKTAETKTSETADETPVEFIVVVDETPASVQDDISPEAPERL